MPPGEKTIFNLSAQENLLIAAYVLLAALLLSLNFYSSWSRVVKLLATCAVVVFFWISYLAWPALLGWPTARDLPKQFYLHAVQIDEPNRIYLWGSDLEQGMAQLVPRAFVVDYSTELHDKVAKASRTLRKGLPVIGRQNDVAEGPRQLIDRQQVNVSDLEFIDAPQALIPGKQ